MKLAEIAARIDAHLKRFEADPKINRYRVFDKKTEKWRTATAEETRSGAIRDYYNAGSGANGRYVFVKYISYQNGTHLSKADAELYLTWLDDGNVGRHYEALKGKK